MSSYRVNTLRFYSLHAVGLVIATLALVGCRKEQVQTTTVDSMSQSSQSPSASSAPMWSGDSSVATSAAPRSGTSPSSPQTASTPSTNTAPGAQAGSGQYAVDEHGNIDTTIKVNTIDTSSAMGQQMLKAMRQQQALKHYTAPRIEGYKLISPQRLADLQPKIPGYQMVRTPAALQVQGLSRSLALLRNTADTSKTIRVTIIDRDANGPINYLEEVNALRQTGSKTEYSEGEPVTAYYVQVGGMPGAKAYLASKKVATLTVVVNPHRLIQLREDKVPSADHLMEVSKYLDVKKFADME